MTQNQSSFFKIIVFVFLTSLFFTILGYFLGQKLSLWKFLEKKTNIINDVVLVKNIAEVSVLEYHSIASHDFDNATKIDQDDNFIIQWWKNTSNSLNRKHLKVSIPYIAKYGVVLQDSNFKIITKNDSLFIKSVESQLLSFELNLEEKQVISEKGWFVFSDNQMFLPLEKYLYDREKQKLHDNLALKKQALADFKEKISLIYKGLGKIVVWT